MIILLLTIFQAEVEILKVVDSILKEDNKREEVVVGKRVGEPERCFINLDENIYSREVIVKSRLDRDYRNVLMVFKRKQGWRLLHKEYSFENDVGWGMDAIWFAPLLNPKINALIMERFEDCVVDGGGIYYTSIYIIEGDSLKNIFNFPYPLIDHIHGMGTLISKVKLTGGYPRDIELSIHYNTLHFFPKYEKEPTGGEILDILLHFYWNEKEKDFKLRPEDRENRGFLRFLNLLQEKGCLAPQKSPGE